MKPYILGVICARGGSKGVANKNIRFLNGKPLIAYAIETAQKTPLIDRVIISTEDPKIMSVAKMFGGDVPFMRPKQLAQDDSPIEPSWKHALLEMERIEGKRADILVSIPTTSPFRQVQDIEACIQKLLNTDADIVVTITPAQRNPYFNMVQFLENEDVRVVVPSQMPIYQRQKAPMVFDMTTVAYAMRSDFLLRCNSYFEGKVKAVIIPQQRALDIDTPFDFRIAELLMKYPL